MTRGRLIVLEGLDGCGKSTLAAGLTEALGAQHWTTPELGLRAVRSQIDVVLSSDSMAGPLFYAASVLAASARIQGTLAGGQDVVCDRYWLTTLVYAQLAGVELQLPGAEQRLCCADTTIFVDVAHEERVRRLQARGMSQLDRKTLNPIHAQQLRDAYLRHRHHRVAGRFVTLDLTALGPQAAVEACALVLQRQAS